MVKNLPAMQETQVPTLAQEDPMEKGMTTHASILAKRIPRTEEPGVLQSVSSQIVRHELVPEQQQQKFESTDTWVLMMQAKRAGEVGKGET